MKKRSVVRRSVAILLAAVMVFSLLPAMKLFGTAGAAVAADKEISGLGTAGIATPKSGESNSPWSGSYVWFGRYEGEPVKYRVLAPKTTSYGGTTMLLDCDAVLFYEPFGSYGSASDAWLRSNLKSYLNGSGFLTKEGVFSAQEINAIAKSTKQSKALTVGNKAGNVASWTKEAFNVSSPLKDDKVFILDVEEISNYQYGYCVDDLAAECRIKKACAAISLGDWGEPWMLRSVRYNREDSLGHISGKGNIWGTLKDVVSYGVSPAMNVDVTSVIFNSVVTGTEGDFGTEYKLTLEDDNLNAKVTSGKTVSVSGSKVTVPYTISGSNASTVSQVSVLILDRAYQAGNANNANILYYGQLDTGNSLPASGTGTFTLPSGLAASGWGSSYQVYILAETINGRHASDFASRPAKVAKPGTTVSLTLTKQPANTTVTTGTTAKFSVTASGTGTLRYQWQAYNPSTKKWVNSSAAGAKTANVSIATQASHDGFKFRCIISDDYGNIITSNAATLTLKLAITTQPKATTVPVGGTATFSVVAGGGGTLKYQWQAYNPTTKKWVNSSSATAKTPQLSITAQTGHHNFKFRCVVTDSKGNSVTSAEALLTVRPGIVTQPRDQLVFYGDYVKFTITAKSAGTLSYQWQVLDTATGTWKNSLAASAKTAQFTFKAQKGHNGKQFRCVLTDSNGNQTVSKTVKVTAYDPADVAIVTN